VPFRGVLKEHGTRQANPNRAGPCMFCFGSIERLSPAVSSYLPGDACSIVSLNLTLLTVSLLRIRLDYRFHSMQSWSLNYIRFTL
jgi:hypothetical protein